VIFKGDDHQPTTCGIPGGKLLKKSEIVFKNDSDF
jgi:hypothetical protein